MPVKTLGHKGGWIVRSHVGYRGERNIFKRVWKPLPSKRVLKILRENSKKTISTSGGLRVYMLSDGKKV